LFEYLILLLFRSRVGKLFDMFLSVWLKNVWQPSVRSTRRLQTYWHSTCNVLQQSPMFLSRYRWTNFVKSEFSESFWVLSMFGFCLKRDSSDEHFAWRSLSFLRSYQKFLLQWCPVRTWFRAVSASCACVLDFRDKRNGILCRPLDIPEHLLRGCYVTCINYLFFSFRFYIHYLSWVRLMWKIMRSYPWFSKKVHIGA